VKRGVDNMATAIARGDKTKFVTDFLTNNPKGTLRTINEAWTSGGMAGTISKTVVDKTRARLGLTGNLSGKTKKAAKTRASAKRTRTPAATPGKAGFTKEFLNDHPAATAREVNEAWTEAGMRGAISNAVVSEVRKSLGLAGRTSTKSPKQPARNTAPARKRRGRKPATQIRASSKDSGTSRQSARTKALMAAEVEIDRLIFQMMELGDLMEIETALRAARRAVYEALTS
jgi:hypothetical protein